MNNCFSDFTYLINQCSSTMCLFEYLESYNIPLDKSDLLRWQHVLAISALDKYIHDIVRVGMVNEFLGKKPKTSKFKLFKITFSDIQEINASDYPELEMEKEIIKQHRYLAFQDPDKIAEALSFIWDEQHKWKVISQTMSGSISEKDLRIKLKNIVLRRNQIVHQGDYSFEPLLEQQKISKEDVINVVEFVKELVNAIDKCIDYSCA